LVVDTYRTLRIPLSTVACGGIPASRECTVERSTHVDA
jgi:hypothetical protein